MTNTTTKERLLSAISTIAPLTEYEESDCIFSEKYAFSATDMVYILQALAKEFNFTIGDEFVDAMEMCTFTQLEALLEKHENTHAGNN